MALISEERFGRVPEASVDERFVERWSPRAFSTRPVEQEKLRSLFEAARWAPSCYNDQPWLFVVAQSEADLALFRPLLVEGNRAWADRAPVLAFLFARRHFRHNGKANLWAEHDAGAAWMSLALMARELGLATHAMAGFHRAEAHETLRLPVERFTACCAIAIGYPDEAGVLPEKLREREKRSGRLSLEEIVVRGVPRGYDEETGPPKGEGRG